MHHDHKADARAAFMGLIFGAIALLGIELDRSHGASAAQH
jgi:hypothetical protein